MQSVVTTVVDPIASLRLVYGISFSFDLCTMCVITGGTSGITSIFILQTGGQWEWWRGEFTDNFWEANVFRGEKLRFPPTG